MKTVSIRDLEAGLSALLAEAAAGETILVTLHGRPIARITAVDPGLHVGPRFGKARLAPLLAGRTRGRYLDVIADDRGGGREGPGAPSRYRESTGE
jgi:prevent-host-death family protein